MDTNQPTETTPSAPAEEREPYAKVVLHRSAPSDYGRRYGFAITAKTEKIGNQSPYFSVTGDIYHKSTRTRTGDGTRACGCLHDEILKACPKLAPIVRLHLADAITGAPTHAEANGFYWLAGAVGGLGEQYTGATGSSARTPEECLQILADHLRVSLQDAAGITNAVHAAYTVAFNTYEAPPTGPTLNRLDPWKGERQKVATIAARNVFHDYITEQSDRWEYEAREGVQLIQELAASKK